MFTDTAYGTRPVGRDRCGFLKELGLGRICSRGAPDMYGVRTSFAPEDEQ